MLGALPLFVSLQGVTKHNERCRNTVLRGFEVIFVLNLSAANTIISRTVDFYTKNNSRVYCSFLDASKAFDRLVHSGLFVKLMERIVPKILLDILITCQINGMMVSIVK